MSQKRMTRREALALMGTGMGAALVAACAPQPAAQVAEATKVVPPTEAPKPVTLRYQNHWTKETDAHYKGMGWLYETFQKQNPNVIIENILNPDSIEFIKRLPLTALRVTAQKSFTARGRKCGSRDIYWT